MAVILKSLPMEIKATSNGNLVFKISTNIPDRDGDILEPQGVNLERYRANPCVLFAHDYSSLPVGKSLWEKVYDDSIESEVEFAPTAFAQDCKKLCEGGFLNAASVGFIGLDYEPIPESKWGKRYKSWELLEWSIVPVPSNFGSLVQNAKSKGINLDAMERELMQMETEVKEEKSGATVSAKNRELLAAIHTAFDGNTRKLKEFLDAVMPMEPDPMMTAEMTMPMMDPMMTAEMTMPMMEPMMTAMRTATVVTIELSGELKQALDGLTAKVTSLDKKIALLNVSPDKPKAQSEEIDLDAIESPKAVPNPANIELNIEPGELKNLIAQAVRETIRGGIQS